MRNIQKDCMFDYFIQGMDEKIRYPFFLSITCQHSVFMKHKHPRRAHILAGRRRAGAPLPAGSRRGVAFFRRLCYNTSV